MPEPRTLSTKFWKAAAFFSLALLLFSARTGFSSDLAEDFMAAREGYADGDAARLDAHARKLQGSPLQPYAEYWKLSMNLADAGDARIEAFLARYDGSLLAERLRKAWLKSLVKSENWKTFTAQYPAVINPDTELYCDWLQAREELGDKDAAREAKPLWFSSKGQPQSCGPLFRELIASNQISSKDIWARLRMVLESGDLTLARTINGEFPKGEGMQDNALVSAYENPYRYLRRNDAPRSRAQKEITIFAVMRIAMADPEQARTCWSELSDHFDHADRDYVLGKIAFRAARKHMPQALQWFEGVDNLDDEELAWKVRAALREKNWTEVLSGIDAMSAPARESEAWRYWKARALKSTGNIGGANAILAPLSREHDFYGQLALEEMGTVATLPPDAYKASEAEITAVENSPGIERALLLYSMGLRVDATSEWIWAVRGFDDRQLLAAAELARRQGLYDRAINTAEKTTQLNDFGLRFLAPYRDVMHEQTQQLGLDEAWVYGLIRQESRFVTVARSGVGASGLMQLMPATAKWVASRLGLRDFRHSLVNQIETNISLGTYYLKHVLTVLDNQPVLASAAYNAGPVRAKRWIGPSPMEGAVYIESIPFDETRDYVKKVMSNTEYYASAFGEATLPLKQRLGIVSSVGGSLKNEP